MGMNMNTFAKSLAFPLLLAVAVASLYLPFVSSPPFFDDLNYFNIAALLAREEFHFAPRWGARWLIGRTFEFFGQEPDAFRITSLAIHLMVGLSVYFFVRQLLRVADFGPAASFAAFAGSLLFLIHPMATFAVGYIIQNTILLAMLFCVLAWHAWLHGTVSGQARWLYISALLFFIACFSKEHAVTGMTVIALLSIWLRRSGYPFGHVAGMRSHQIAAGVLIMLVAVAIVLGQMGILFIPYEPEVAYIVDELSVDRGLIYPISVLTQLGLFFKYLFLWLVPNTEWMSLDMREPFVQTLNSWRHAAAVAGFLAYVGIGLAFLWRGGRIGLVGVALLIPALMFATEVSTARIQDAFVLYRTYLWLPVAFALAVALIITKIRLRLSATVLAVVATFLVLFSVNQLTTFSQHVFIWQQALAALEGKSNLLGEDRIHHNLGQAYYDLGMRDEAMKHYDRAIELAPDIPYSYVNRGALFHDLKRYDEALADFDRSLSMTVSGNALMGRALVLESVGDKDGEIRALLAACSQKFFAACKKLESKGVTITTVGPAKPATQGVGS